MTLHTRESVDAHKRATGITPMPPAMRKAFDREYPETDSYRSFYEDAIEWALTWLTRNGHVVERADAPTDPLDTPLPCAVTIGKVTFGKGVKLRSLVNKARRDSDLVQAMDKKEMMQLAASLDALRECDIDESPDDLPEDPPNDALIRAHARYQARKVTDQGAGSVFEFPGLEARRRDAERYQWLRNHYGLGNLHTADHTLICLYRVSYSGSSQGLDRCIDAAIAAEREAER